MDDIQRAELIKEHIEECKHRISVVNNFMATNKDADEDNCCRNIMRLKAVISAMEELRQYRGLCKLEEVEHLKTLTRIIRRNGTIGKALDVCAKYEDIGTLEECREAREKQEPMEVTDIHVDEYYCPSCGTENCCDQGIVGDKHCPYCGQALKQRGIK